ncbi:hypothetical protein [Alkaliphilus serpentinus]|uniref:HPt domain-containing protein n=1 Tax=Alkaliphilus serpentinus TaxID=1482731 RepID=A0A833HM39_9FIRM|nr:hypothetical protein [Alkaliphilus serpentinus]KAB3527132.1 hypothetical protein F8153_13250 [Alkaliphilus serpentinus]
MDIEYTNCVEEFMENTGLELHEAAELYKIFLEELEGEVLELKGFINNGYNEKAQKTVHNVKGISSNYFALKVYSLAKELDQQFKLATTNNIDFMLNGIQIEAANLKVAIKEIFKEKGIALEV